MTTFPFVGVLCIAHQALSDRPTCDPLHPGGVIDTQVVVEDLEDVSQDDAEVV